MTPYTGQSGITSSDAELCLAAGRGDRNAFLSLFLRLADPAWRLANAVVGEPGDARLAAVSGWTTLLGSITSERTRIGTDVDLELLHLTRRSGQELLLRRRTRARHLPAPPTGAIGGEAAESAGDPSAVSALRRLPERWRSALWVSTVEGLAPVQAGRVLSCSARAAERLSRHAATAFRQHLIRAQLEAGVDPPCRYPVGRLGAYAGGGLGRRLVEEVDVHLAGCEACRARLGMLEDPGTTLSESSPRPPGDLMDAAWQSWLAAAATPQVPPRRVHTPIPGRRTLAGATTALLGLGVAGAVLLGGPSLASVKPAGHARSGPAASAPRSVFLSATLPAIGGGARGVTPAALPGARAASLPAFRSNQPAHPTPTAPPAVATSGQPSDRSAGTAGTAGASAAPSGPNGSASGGSPVALSATGSPTPSITATVTAPAAGTLSVTVAPPSGGTASIVPVYSTSSTVAVP